MSDTRVLVPTLTSGTPIDNVSVVTGVGTVNRQRITIADLATEVDASQTVGTVVATAIAAGLITTWLDIENVSNNGNLLGFTLDGSTPGFTTGQANAGTFVLLPYGTKTYDSKIPNGALKIVGSAAGTVVTIKYA